MCGSETFTTVVSRTSINVPNITATAIHHGLTCGIEASVLVCSMALLDSNLHNRRHAWPQLVFSILTRIEHQLHRNALNDLHVITRSVLRRQQTEFCAGSGSDAVHVSVENSASKSIDGDCCSLALVHICQLSFFKVRRDPNIFLRNDSHQRLSGLHDLSGF